MMFYRIPINTDLSKTSYRCMKLGDTCDYIEYNSGYIDDEWEELQKEDIVNIAPEWFIQSKEFSQLDKIQIAVEKSNEELRQEGADALTLELVESGII